jgi:hypothetical protein
MLRGRPGSLGNYKEQEIEVKIHVCVCDMLRVFARPNEEEKILYNCFLYC